MCQIAQPREIISSVSEKKVEKNAYFGELYASLETVLIWLQCSQVFLKVLTEWQLKNCFGVEKVIKLSLGNVMFYLFSLEFKKNKFEGLRTVSSLVLKDFLTTDHQAFL